MDDLRYYIVGYILLINLYAFMSMRKDKAGSRQNLRRIPEKSFFLLAFWGAAVGIYLGMKTYRHKTKHTSFVLGIPILIVWNLVLYYVLLFYW